MFKLEFETDNSAFEDMDFETVRILRELASKIENGIFPESIKDINGNTIGKVHIDS